MRTYLSKNGQKTGPYEDAEIHEGLASGAFSLTDLAWREGIPEWLPLATLYPAAPTAPELPARDENAGAPIPVGHECAPGDLDQRRVFRFGMLTGVIGFIIMIPCVIGLLIGSVGLYGAKKADTHTSAIVDQKAKKRLEERGVPAPIIARVLANEWLNDDELSQLTHDQQALVDQYKTEVSVAKTGVDFGSVLAGGVAVALMIASFIGVLIGWLLTLRKSVLRCRLCGTLAPAK